MKLISAIWILLLVLTGCARPEAESAPDFLIRVGSSIMTPAEFDRAFEVCKTSYDYEQLDAPEALKAAKLRFLREMIEQLTLTERARELQLTISDAELGTAVKEMQSGYPEGEFKKSLLESALSYRAWRDGLRTRMLMEKVVRKDLAETLPLSPQEIEAFRVAQKTGKKTKDRAAAEAPDDPVVEAHLRREKTEASYPGWVETLRKRYTVQINRERLEELLNS
ncbi:hypothetical protein DENIS_5137 [Desulfonema ishimotonii]|uniref:PpiC domain-containing protein n=1 Tax=Desulfonema ishimotonii TaxID=45657 RepID=A0A401G4H7_9BACT|nr:SurA N-terminal domain-containing protein [Desulfonema ishimotonii]GBC64120.1 hypothetical protein DENIS_5137 [Desulfonema ishimotonii]